MGNQRNHIRNHKYKKVEALRTLALEATCTDWDRTPRDVQERYVNDIHYWANEINKEIASLRSKLCRGTL